MASLREIETGISQLSPQKGDESLPWLGEHTPPQPINLQIKASLEAGRMDESIRRAVADYEAERTGSLQTTHRANADFPQDYWTLPMRKSATYQEASLPGRRNKAEDAADEILLRLIRDDDVPASHELVEPFIFGLQDTQQQVVAAERGADGKLVFNFSLQVRRGANPERPIFTGRFASGPVNDRFVYLSWRSVPRGV